MPRKPITEHYLYSELEQYVSSVEVEGRAFVDDLKMQIVERESKMQYQKSKAIMHAIKSGLSVYGAAKAAGIKSSAKKLNVVADAEKVIAEYESETH
jgi:hypothetical protein